MTEAALSIAAENAVRAFLRALEEGDVEQAARSIATECQASLEPFRDRKRSKDEMVSTAALFSGATRFQATLRQDQQAAIVEFHVENGIISASLLNVGNHWELTKIDARPSSKPPPANSSENPQ